MFKRKRFKTVFNPTNHNWFEIKALESLFNLELCYPIKPIGYGKEGLTMVLTGKIEVFKNKKGYPVGILKSFSQDGELLGKMFVGVYITDEKLAKKVVDGKTLTIDVETGYLNVRHVELETESFEKFEISIVKGKVVAVFPEDKPASKKKSTK